MFRSTREQVYRVCRILAGLTLLIVGAVLSVPGIPGPGILVIFLGFGILSQDFKWASRWHTRLKGVAERFVKRGKSLRNKETPIEQQKSSRK